MRESEEGSRLNIFINKRQKLNSLPDVLMLLKYRVELDGSLLQFKHKVSFMLNNDLPNPPIGKGEKNNEKRVRRSTGGWLYLKKYIEMRSYV